MSSKNKKSDAPSGSGSRKPRFPELPPKYSSSRELRNKAEKMRRDRLNKLIEEMRSLVPMISNKTKKSDTTRSSILRLTANFLRVSRLFPQDATEEGTQNSENAFLGEGLPHLESMEGFFFILAEDGRVLYVSENIDKFIGFSQIEMMGFPIYNFTHPADQSKIQSNLSKKEKKSPCPSPHQSLQAPSPSNVPASSSSSDSHALVVPSSSQSSSEERGPRQSFYIRLREKPLAKHDKPQYEHMHVVGHLRKTENVDDRNNSVGQNTFIGVMRPVRDRPITELSLMESIQDQYLTRHLPDGRIIYTDHRISTIAGYLPSEVKGKSAFNFFYAEDLPWTTMAMRHMFASSNGEGSTVYRLFTQTGELICLQTKGFLEFNKTTNKIESFLCINTVIRPEDTDRYLNEQKERFTPFITEVQINAMASSNQSFGLTSSSTPTLPSLKQSSTSSPPSFLQLLSSPSEISVISNGPPSTAAASRSPSEKEMCQSSSKRLFSEVSSEHLAEPFQYIEGPPSKKSYVSQSVSNSNFSHKRKLEEFRENRQDFQSSKITQNWQYTPAREEPVHRNEDGIRVVDIDQQFFPEDILPNPGLKKEESHTEFESLINQLNKTNDYKNTLHLNSGGFSTEQLSPNYPCDSPVTEIPPQNTRNVLAGQRRVGSVLRMLPQRQKMEQDMSSPSLDRKSAMNFHNPLDNGGFLDDFLSPLTNNQTTINSNPIEADIIKKELMNSSSSEAARIAEKLKVMLTPLRPVHVRTQDKSISEASIPSVVFPNPQNSDDSNLFDILNQDLIFSLENTSKKLSSSSLKDEVPSTSS